MPSDKVLEIYTDGAYVREGYGGWAFVHVCIGEELKRGSGRLALSKTKSQRMEVLAVLRGLEAVKGEWAAVFLYTDSLHLVKSLTGWARPPLRDRELWQRIKKLADKWNVEFRHVKSHSGDKWNEVVDRLAHKETVQARRINSK